MLRESIQYLAGAVMGLSLVTLVGGVFYLIFRLLKKSRGVSVIKVLTVVTGILSAAGTTLIKASGGEVTTRDEGRDVITSFYAHVQNKEFAQAFDLIHDARKAEMKGQGRTYEDFKQTYASTRDYQNMQIDFDKSESATSRLYWVAFDAKDSFPGNTLFDESWQPSSRMLDRGVLAEDKLLAGVLSDMARFYTVPTDAGPKVRQYIRNAPLHYILEPSFIADVSDSLRLERSMVNGAESWSHHIEHVKLQPNNGWKIRSGLYPPIFIGTYPPFAEHPSLTTPSTPPAK